MRDVFADSNIRLVIYLGASKQLLIREKVTWQNLQEIGFEVPQICKINVSGAKLGKIGKMEMGGPVPDAETWI